jgi:hypothetical protein
MVFRVFNGTQILATKIYLPGNIFTKKCVFLCVCAIASLGTLRVGILEQWSLLLFQVRQIFLPNPLPADLLNEIVIQKHSHTNVPPQAQDMCPPPSAATLK